MTTTYFTLYMIMFGTSTNGFPTKIDTFASKSLCENHRIDLSKSLSKLPDRRFFVDQKFIYENSFCIEVSGIKP